MPNLFGSKTKTTVTKEAHLVLTCVGNNYATFTMQFDDGVPASISLMNGDSIKYTFTFKYGENIPNPKEEIVHGGDKEFLFRYIEELEEKVRERHIRELEEKIREYENS